MEDIILSRYEIEKRILFREESDYKTATETTTDESQVIRRQKLNKLSSNDDDHHHLDQLKLPSSAKLFFKSFSSQSYNRSTRMIKSNQEQTIEKSYNNANPNHASCSSKTISRAVHPNRGTRRRRRCDFKSNSGVVNSMLLLLVVIVSSSSICSALDSVTGDGGISSKSASRQPDSSAGDEPRAEAITMARNNDKQDLSPDVILIKYANVTNANKDSGETSINQEDDALGQQIELNLFKLNEPLSVSVIESKFAHSIQLFDVSHNQLSTLSKDLFCPLSNEVRQLNISYNLLENFDCLGLISQAGQLCLSELRILDMSYNLIKHLPATGVATLHNLEILNLSHNLIESLDELSLSSLVKLTKLDLSANKIQQLPIRIFHKSTSMQVLRLQSNYLQTSISQMFLSGLISLEELNLSFNNISHLSDLAFLDKVNLTRVDLTHNQLRTLGQEALRVTSVRQANGYKQRLHHNGQYAGVSPKQTHSQSASAEFFLASNPFICDCQLDWLRKFQPSSAIKRTVLSSSSINSNRLQLGEQVNNNNNNNDQLSAQLMHLTASSASIRYQNDQPPVISAPSSSSDPSNNISEIISSQQQQQRQQRVDDDIRPLASSLTNGNSQQHLTQHYARVGDLDLIKCTPLFRRNKHHHHHDKQPSASFHRHVAGGQLRPTAPSDGAHLTHSQHHHHLYQQSNGNSLVRQQQQQETMIDLFGADSSNFLCRYKSHCFALCQCCEFDACDCEMICPSNCNCYYDSTWQSNIIDCSSNNHTVVPDRIPMDVSGLYLDGNDIVSLKPSNLIARRFLKTLYLNSSNLQYIANRTFNGLIELQTLYLHDNMLRSLNGYEFEPLAKLKALYLQSNRLDHISNQTFIYLRSLEVLDLSNNRLTSANLDLFRSIGHHNIRLRQLNIAHNWWSCQCSSINMFRQILKQKFLVAGSVNIADKNQLRCYYNSTTVGPFILADGVSSSALQQQQQPLYASYPVLSSSSSSSSSSMGPSIVAGNRQQTLLNEINQCSEIIENYQEPGNPPIIDVVTDSPSITPPNEYPNDPFYSHDPNNLPPPQISNHDSPIYNQPSPFLPPSDTNLANFGNNGAGTIGEQAGSPSSSMPLTFYILLSMLSAIILVISLSIYVFIRQQQQQQSHHKKSSAASTTSGSSSASSTAISSLNGKPHHHHHRNQHQHQHHIISHQTMQNSHHQHHHNNQHHHLIMSNGTTGGLTNTITNHLHHQSLHHHSASSQSNIYAALVSPSTGNSTTLTNQINNNGNNNNLISASHNSNNNSSNNNPYSNSSTTASHHSSSSQGQHGVYQQHWPPLVPGHQHSVYNQPYASNNGPGESHYAINASASQSSYKTGGSLYNAPGNCHEASNGPFDANSGGQTADWIRLPKVKQFMSKLVNKSLSIGGYRSVSRDELSAITSDKIYDAFISYDKRDEAFVMQHLSAELEYGQPQYRIADRYRDLPLPSSSYIAEAITSVIGCSHRTIMVLTENYLASEWCRYELQAALHEASLDKSHKIIAVVLDPKCLLEMDNEMRALLTNSANSVSIYQPNGRQQQSPQLVQLDGVSELQQQQQLIATLTNQTGAHQQVSTQTAQLATSRITFINYNERKFWPKIKQLMPTPRPSTQTLTLTTKN